MTARRSRSVETTFAPFTPAARGADSRTGTRIALVTGVRLLQEGLARLLRDRDPLLTVDAVMPDGAIAARLAPLAPDVVLVDIATLRALRGALQEAVPASRLVVFAVDEAEDDLLACAEAGVAGFVGREASVEELLAAIASAQRGELHCSPRVAALIFRRLTALVRHDGEQLALTIRQRQIVQLIEQGLSNKEIARHLSIEVSTVKNHVHNVLGKLQVQHRWQAPFRVAPRIARLHGE